MLIVLILTFCMIFEFSWCVFELKVDGGLEIAVILILRPIMLLITLCSCRCETEDNYQDRGKTIFISYIVMTAITLVCLSIFVIKNVIDGGETWI